MLHCSANAGKVVARLNPHVAPTCRLLLRRRFQINAKARPELVDLRRASKNQRAGLSKNTLPLRTSMVTIETA
jgi:hypothetical protein